MAPKEKDGKAKTNSNKELIVEGVKGGKGLENTTQDAKKGSKTVAKKDQKDALENVNSTVEYLMENLEEHIQDGDLLPRYIAHAVSVTLAQMVNLLCVSHVNRMENWNSSCEGSVPSEWLPNPEPQLPDSDSWARSSIPLFTNHVDIAYSDLVACNNPIVKPERRATAIGKVGTELHDTTMRENVLKARASSAR